jgi:ABC-type transport system involved in multi-copper enzyme maturation permease subunit
MAGAYAVAVFTLRELARRRVLWVLLALALALVALLGLLPFYLIKASGDRALFILQSLPGVVSNFSLLCAAIIGMSVIYHDLESGAAVALFSKPLSRLAYTAGKVAAAVLAVALVVGSLAAGSQLLVALNGVGYQSLLWVYFASIAANLLLLLLLVMLFTTFMNNLIAAVVGFVIYSIGGGVAWFHALAQAGAIPNGAAVQVINVAFWILPRTLTTNYTAEVFRLAFKLHPPPPGAGSPTYVISDSGQQVFNGHVISTVSGASDVAYLAAYLVILSLILYWGVRRRQV